MVARTRAEILDAIRGAGARNSRLEFMRICSAHPIDFATANHAFLEGREAARAGRPESGGASQTSATEPDAVEPTGSYIYDFGPCAIAKGWAKFSTAQDDVNFGNWASPTELKWLNYRDGEATVVAFQNAGEFVDYCRASFAWYEQHDGRPPSMESGFNQDLRAELIRMGLGDMLSRD
jgi:hypothetical protein